MKIEELTPEEIFEAGQESVLKTLRIQQENIRELRSRLDNYAVQHVLANSVIGGFKIS